MKNFIPRVGLTVLGMAVLALLVAVGHWSNSILGQGAAGNAAASNSPRGESPAAEVDSVWEDFPVQDLGNTNRLKDRPGNFEILKKVGELFEGLYLVEPVMRDCAYPFNNNGRRFESQEADVKATKAREDGWRKEGQTMKNMLRSFNVVIHKTTLLHFAEGVSTTDGLAALGVNTRQFEKARADHKEQCWLVLIRAGLESLQSEKILGNSSDTDFTLCYVKKPDGWKLVWFEKG